MRALKELNVAHFDMDAFYASIESNLNPHLKNKPFAVGRKSKRGIVTTASYEARKYGVRSAMPIFMAKSLCPSLMVVEPHMNLYIGISKEIFTALSRFGDRIEKLSVDEGFIDLSSYEKTPEEFIREIKELIYGRFQLTMSVGISYNKFLAKLASDWNKPDGFFIITKDMVPDILSPLDVKKIYGIGHSTSKKLNDMGIYKVSDIQKLDRDFLSGIFGKHGNEIYDRAFGIDRRPIESDRIRKSIGVEHTLEVPVKSPDSVKAVLFGLVDELFEDMCLKKLRCSTLTLKLKDRDFKTVTRSLTLPEAIMGKEEFIRIAESLYESVENKHSYRLIGISASNLTDDGVTQLSLNDILNIK